MNFFLKWECQNGHAKFIYHEYMINAAGSLSRRNNGGHFYAMRHQL